MRLQAVGAGAGAAAIAGCFFQSETGTGTSEARLGARDDHLKADGCAAIRGGDADHADAVLRARRSGVAKDGGDD